MTISTVSRKTFVEDCGVVVFEEDELIIETGRKCEWKLLVFAGKRVVISKWVAVMTDPSAARVFARGADDSPARVLSLELRQDFL